MLSRRALPRALPRALRAPSWTAFLPLLALSLAGCGHAESTAAGQASSEDAAGAPSAIVKLSTFGQAQYCSIATGRDGTLHALFTDAKKYGDSHFVYYRASSDGGATWSDAKNLSDDDSGLGTSWCQIKVDAAGRVYAIWKAVDERTVLDGPGGNNGGTVAIRCLDGGSWSKAQRFGDDHHEAVAWYAMNAPDGKVHILYTQLQADILDHDRKTNGNISGNVADDLAMLTLDGANPATRTPIIAAKPLPTPAEIQARHEAGKDFTYEESHIKRDGLWNLRGYVADDGRPHFIAEKYQATSADPVTIVRYDGAKLATFYEYKKPLNYNTFGEPPAFFRAADGKEHFVRRPETSESDVIRDYVVVGSDGTPGDPTDAIAISGDRVKIFHWQSNALADGRIVAFAALSPKGMYDDADDLYVAISDGHGKWSAPLNVTDNDARAKSFAKAAVSQSSSYQPESAEATSLKGGDVGVIMVNTEHTLSGLNTVAITGTGRAVEGMSSTSSSSPVMENGTWSKPRLFGDEHEPMVSWFAAADSKGKVNVVYSHADEAVDWATRGTMYKNANNVDQLVFDGANAPAITHLQVASHVLTEAEQKAMQATGKYPAYELTVPKNDGPWNLNGYIADDGRPRFLAEKCNDSGAQETILRFDGHAFSKFYEYKGYVGNTFGMPPILLRLPDGTEHVIRKPEASENEVLRDYVVKDGKPGDKTDVITNDAPKATVNGYWACPLASGRIAAMASVSPNVDVFGPTDLYVSIADGKGGWSKPVNVTDNDGRATSFARAGTSQSTSYRPTFADAAVLKDGSLGVILLNSEKTISGLDVVGITSSGRAVTGTSSFSTESPYVSFVKVKG